jgi:hypothetical protein
LTSPCEVKFANCEKTPLRAGSHGQVASLCQFLYTSDLSDPNDKPKRDFGVKLCQILTSPCEVKFANCEKNAVTGWFPWSSYFTVPIFVHIGFAGSDDKPKRDFGAKLGQIFTFDLSARGQICKF